MEEPKLVEDVRTQVKDIEIRKTRELRITFQKGMEHHRRKTMW